MIAFFPLQKLMYSLRELVISGETFFCGGKKILSCKLKHIECLLLDPSSQRINNLALHFALGSEEYIEVCG